MLAPHLCRFALPREGLREPRMGEPVPRILLEREAELLRRLWQVATRPTLHDPRHRPARQQWSGCLTPHRRPSECAPAGAAGYPREQRTAVPHPPASQPGRCCIRGSSGRCSGSRRRGRPGRGPSRRPERPHRKAAGPRGRCGPSEPDHRGWARGTGCARRSASHLGSTRATSSHRVNAWCSRRAHWSPERSGAETLAW